MFQSLFFNKVAGLCFINTEALAQVFSSEFCKISKNTFSNRTPPLAASVSWSLKTVYPVRICRICTYISRYISRYNCISRNYGNCGNFVKASWKNRKNFNILRISEWRRPYRNNFFFVCIVSKWLLTAVAFSMSGRL